MRMPDKVRKHKHANALDRQLKQIREEFFDEMVRQTRGTPVRPELLACMMPNESGKFQEGHPRQGQINPNASRFEKHVYAALIRVRDGAQTKYGRIRRKDLIGISNQAMENLARSWGALQTMGYYVLQLFTDTDGTPVTIAELRDIKRHFRYCTQLLLADEPSQDEIAELNRAVEKNIDSEIIRTLNRIARRWNTGKPNGTPYHGEIYVDTVIYCFYRWKELYNFRGEEEMPDVEHLALTVGDDFDDDGDSEVIENPDTHPELALNDVPEPIPNPENEIVPDSEAQGVMSPNPEPEIVAATQTAESNKDAIPMVEQWWNFTKSIPAKIYGALTIGGIGGAAGIGEWLQVYRDNKSTVLWGVFMVAILVVGVFLMYSRRKREDRTQQQLFEMQKLLAEIAADPNRQNVTFKKPEEKK